MKLFLHDFANDNFGDALNSVLIAKMFDGILDDDSDLLCFAIGSLLNDFSEERARNARKILVIGSGVSHGKISLGNLPAIDERWKLYALRGPLSAVALGVSQNLAMVDPGVLINTLPGVSDLVANSKAHDGRRPALIPHINTIKNSGSIIRKACEEIGINYIEPTGNVRSVIEEIARSSYVLAEAMHGAIAADSIRVPWRPVILSKSFESFKWLDWCRSLKVPYKPVKNVVPTYPRRAIDLIRFRWRKKEFINQLSKLAHSSEAFVLSDPDLLKTQSQRLLVSIETLKQDVSRGNI